MKQLLILKKVITELVLYGLVGGVSTGIELGLMKILISHFKLWYIYASIIVSSISLVISFILRKIWVFKNKDKHQLFKQLIVYTFILSSIVVINSVIVAQLVESAGLDPIVSQFLSGLFVGLIGFILNRSITFKYL